MILSARRVMTTIKSHLSTGDFKRATRGRAVRSPRATSTRCGCCPKVTISTRLPSCCRIVRQLRSRLFTDAIASDPALWAWQLGTIKPKLFTGPMHDARSRIWCGPPRGTSAFRPSRWTVTTTWPSCRQSGELLCKSKRRCLPAGTIAVYVGSLVSCQFDQFLHWRPRHLADPVGRLGSALAGN